LTIAAQFGDAQAGDFLTAGRRDSTRAFRVAVRHSRLVRTLRVGIPVLLVAMIAGATVYRYLDPMRALVRAPVGADGMVLSGTKIIMQQPRLVGFTKDERPYTVVARTASKDLTNPDAMEMEDVRATVVTPDHRDVLITAREGFYNGKAQTMRLKNNVVVSSPEYEALLKDALMHVRTGQVVSEEPVVVHMLQGTINANRLEIQNSGEVIRFDKGVVMVIDREDTPALVTGKTP
jgi:lipopolysaccharide export system protein LptC